MPRKEKNYHFIYKTTNLLNGKYYIGMHSTNELEDGYLGSGKRLRYSINKYGEENHERIILEYCDSRSELKSREEEIVNLNEIAKVECMNLKVGGNGGFSNDEHRMKYSKAGTKSFVTKLKTDPEFLKEHKKRSSEIFKKAWKEGKFDNMPNGFKGKKHTEETKKKMRSVDRTGTKNSQFGSRWITNGEVNKKIKKTDSIPEGWKLGRLTK